MRAVLVVAVIALCAGAALAAAAPSADQAVDLAAARSALVRNIALGESLGGKPATPEQVAQTQNLFGEALTRTRAALGGRQIEGDGYVIYRLPLSDKDVGCEVLVWVQGDYVVSLAPQQDGKPGRFRDVAVARDKYRQDELEQFGNMDDVRVPISRAMIAAGGCYVKLTIGEPSKPGGVIVRDLSLRRP